MPKSLPLARTTPTLPLREALTTCYDLHTPRDSLLTCLAEHVFGGDVSRAALQPAPLPTNGKSEATSLASSPSVTSSGDMRPQVPAASGKGRPKNGSAVGGVNGGADVSVNS